MGKYITDISVESYENLSRDATENRLIYNTLKSELKSVLKTCPINIYSITFTKRKWQIREFNSWLKDLSGNIGITEILIFMLRDLSLELRSIIQILDEEVMYNLQLRFSRVYSNKFKVKRNSLFRFVG